MKKITIIVSSIFISLFCYVNYVYAHCDTMDGPVVADSKKAFDSKNINYALKWVKAGDEAEVRQAFDLAMKVRPLNNDAKLVAEQYFYNILIRVHRAAEGESFTGVKPSGTPIDENVREADKAIESGNLSKLETMVPKNRLPELKERYNKVMTMKNFDVNDLNAGREYIEAYVQFFKYAEGEEGHGHGKGGESEALHILIISLIVLSVVLFITTIIFGVKFYRLKRD